MITELSISVEFDGSFLIEWFDEASTYRVRRYPSHQADKARREVIELAARVGR